MNKVLIIGGGRSGRCFCESLLLYSTCELTLSSACDTGQTIQLARQYDLKFLLYSRLSTEIMKFDVVIVATPLGTKSSIVQNIVNWGYNRAIILEKPVSLNLKDFNIINKLIKDNGIRCIVPYSRRYMKLDIPVATHYNITVPTMERSNAFFHQLPHILDLLLMLDNSLSLIISDVRYLGDQLVVCGKVGISSFRVCLYIHYVGNGKIVINGENLEWPTLKIYNEMVQDLLVGRDNCYYNEKKEQIIFDAMTEIVVRQTVTYTNGE